MEFLGIRLLRPWGFYGKGLLVIESYRFQCFWGLAPPEPYNPPHALRDEAAAETCSYAGIGRVSGINSIPKPIGLENPPAFQVSSDLFQSAFQSSHWVVDGYSMFVTAILWWHRRPRRL